MVVWESIDSLGAMLSPLTTLFTIKMDLILLDRTELLSTWSWKVWEKEKKNSSIVDPEGKIMAADGGTPIHGN